MASERQAPTLADYVVIVISPALIMGMVGSLALFLLQVMYRGQYEPRLTWTVFFFVFGAVLVARISMIGEIAGRYWIYAPILGLLTLLVLQTYVEYPPDNPATPYRALINLFLVVVVLWCTYVLMWDCTHIDAEGEPTARGLLEAAGLAEGPLEDEAVREQEEAKDPQGIWGWITRYQRYRNKKQRRRVLGVWVVYFALATLPIFGLGQALIDPEDVLRRRLVFWLMSLYAGSALGLLMTTCFLGIRRYLRQRNVKMPGRMTGVWLTSGSVLVLVLLILAALVPRPSAEYRLLDLTPLGKDEQQVSKYSIKKESSGKDKGQPGEKTGDKDKGNGQGKDQPKGPGDKDRKDGQGQGQNDQTKGGGDKSKSAETKSAEAKAGEPPAKPKDEVDRAIAEQAQEMSSVLKEAVQNLTKFIKTLAFIIVGLIVLMALMTGGLRYLANFTQWARALLDWLQTWWARLFGSPEQRKKAQRKQAAALPKLQVEDRPFAWFRNPWSDGTAGQRKLQELIRFTFAALQAWSADRGVLRELGETPLEFAARVGEEAPALAEDIDRFIALYLRAEYANGKLPASSVEDLRHFWERLEQAAEQPLSA